MWCRLKDTDGQSQPAYKQTPLSPLPEGWSKKSVSEHVTKWLRLLRLEEAALHQDIKRYTSLNTTAMATICVQASSKHASRATRCNCHATALVIPCLGAWLSLCCMPTSMIANPMVADPGVNVVCLNRFLFYKVKGV